MGKKKAVSVKRKTVKAKSGKPVKKYARKDVLKDLEKMLGLDAGTLS